MNHLPRLLCLCFLLIPCAARADLAGDVNNVLADKQLRKSIVGIEIVRLGEKRSDDSTLYAKDKEAALIPASNLKLLSTSAALHKLGPDYKFRTTLVASEPDLAILGGGDPTFGDAEFLKDVGWNVYTVFENWADQLARRNITRVRDVIVDDSIFDEEFLHPSWPLDQIQKKYQAEVGGFNLNANILEFSVRPTAVGQIATYATSPDTLYASVKNTCVTGNQNAIWLSREVGTNQIILRGETPTRAQIPVAVTIHDPPLYGATVFAEVLKRKGIQVTGSIRRDRSIAKKNWKAVALHETPLPTVLSRANKKSVNLYAESLCKLLGHEMTGKPGSWENGTAALGEFLKSIGVAETEFNLDDGCGLSKKNAISAEAFVKILAHNFHSPYRETFRSTLAIAGVDGTMEDRFRGSDLRQRVFAKSGYVNGVCSLSGYLKAKDGRWYAFSILMNRAPGLANMQQLQEKIIKAVDANAQALADTR
jgi:D-alanyl-D-alanine carboxypeptidase/D-alanyl-D-alanine-endopeptidase (penicillin-binding protein 4)